MSRFAQTGGAFGPIRGAAGRYSQPANPWVAKRASFSGAFANQQLAIGVTTKTLAGHPDSCCSACANNHRTK